jgi:hypothetical protein
MLVVCLKKVTSDLTRSETVMKRSGTPRNAQERTTTVRNSQQRSRTVNDQELTYCTRSRSETFTKSRSRYGHVHASKTKELLYRFYINLLNYTIKYTSSINFGNMRCFDTCFESLSLVKVATLTSSFNMSKCFCLDSWIPLSSSAFFTARISLLSFS